MPRRLRATPWGVWWRSQRALIRYCVTCGHKLVSQYIREEHNWRLVCSFCHRITYLNPKVVAGLIPVTAKGEVVLLTRGIEPARGRWSYPAGYQEMGESVETAAHRETWEEVGTKVRSLSLVGIYSYPDSGVVTVVYAGRVRSGQKPIAGTEALDVKVFHKKDIPWKKLAFRSTTDALRDWIHQQKDNKK